MIYESALNPVKWRDTLHDLAKQVGADTFHMVSWNSQEQAATLGVMSHDSWNEAMVLYNNYCGRWIPDWIWR